MATGIDKATATGIDKATATATTTLANDRKHESAVGRFGTVTGPAPLVSESAWCVSAAT